MAAVKPVFQLFLSFVSGLVLNNMLVNFILSTALIVGTLREYFCLVSRLQILLYCRLHFVFARLTLIVSAQVSHPPSIVHFVLFLLSPCLIACCVVRWLRQQPPARLAMHA